MADFDWSSLIGPALGIGGAIYSANQAGDAARNAASSQANALQPYANIGNYALSGLQNIDPAQIPGYATGLDAGLSAINRNAAARGGFNSGNRLKALTKYAIDYNTQQTAGRQNQLMSLLNPGMQAASGIGNAGAASGVVRSNANNSALTGALDLASKYLTSKDSSGNTGAQNLWNGISGLWSDSPASSGSDWQHSGPVDEDVWSW